MKGRMQGPSQMLTLLVLAILCQRADLKGGGGSVGGGGGSVKQAGTNCIKTGLPGKLILSKRKGLREVLFS